MRKILNWSKIYQFSLMWSENFEAKITKSKRREKCEAKKSGKKAEKSEKKRKKAKKSLKSEKSEKSGKKSEKKRKSRLEFRFALFRFEAKITKVKRSEKFEAKISEKKRKEAKKKKWNFIVNKRNTCETDPISLYFAYKLKNFFVKRTHPTSDQ
jgi:hypothetical protein